MRNSFHPAIQYSRPTKKTSCTDDTETDLQNLRKNCSQQVEYAVRELIKTDPKFREKNPLQSYFYYIVAHLQIAQIVVDNFRLTTKG